jgi:hypothetical protein
VVAIRTLIYFACVDHISDEAGDDDDVEEIVLDPEATVSSMRLCPTMNPLFTSK